MLRTRLRRKLVSFLTVSLLLLRFSQGQPPRQPSDDPFEQVIDRYLREIRGGAGLVNDGSQLYFETRLGRTRAFRTALTEVETANLSFDQQIDLRFLQTLLSQRLIAEEELQRWRSAPMVYLPAEELVLHQGGLLVDESLPLGQRSETLRELLGMLPLRLQNARRNLDQFIPLWRDRSLEIIDGMVKLFRVEIPDFAQRVPREKVVLLEAADAAISSLESFREFLVKELPSRPPGDWRMGARLLNRRLHEVELAPELEAESIYFWGRRKFDEQLHVLERLARQIDPARSWQALIREMQEDHPSPEMLATEYQRQAQLTRPWVVAADLASIPWDPQNAASATAAPLLFGRLATFHGGGAPPGPGRVLPGIVVVAPPDPEWDPAILEEFLEGRNRSMIATMITHEIYPGHALVQLYRNQNPRRLRVFETSSAEQAWCYYVEWALAGEHDFFPPQRRRHLQLYNERNRLWRYARIAIEFGMHLGKMSFGEAVSLMQEGVLFGSRDARMQAELMTQGGDGYSTRGYDRIVELRDEYFGRMAYTGRRGTLKDFHDRVLKAGMLPLPLLRETILRELDREREAAIIGPSEWP